MICIRTRVGFGHAFLTTLVALVLAGAADGLWAEDEQESDPAEQAAIAKVHEAGGTVRKIAMSVEWKEVAFHLSDQEVTDDALASLQDINELTWLYLQGTAVTDAGLKHLSDLTSLTKLHLEKTGIGDAGLAHLTGLDKLEYLNLYGTKVTDEGLKQLTGMTSLKKVYLWQSAVTEEGAAALQEALPEADIVLGAKLAEVKKEEEKKEEPKPEPTPEEPAKESLGQGQFVRVRLEGDGRILSLAEVQVLQTGDNAELHRNGKATQSSVDYGGEPVRAHDGNTNQTYSENSVTHTATEKDPWWQIDLGQVQEIGRVKVFNRGDCCGDRLQDGVVEILDDAQKVVWSDKISDARNGSVHAFAK